MRVERLLGVLNGFDTCETSGEKAKSKAPPSKTEGRAPKVLLGFIVRATRPSPKTGDVICFAFDRKPATLGPSAVPGVTCR